MANPQKAKGSSAERAVVEFLREHGFPHAERRLAGSSKDRGDIAGVLGVVIEVKNCAQMTLGAWLAEVALEQVNDNADYGIVWHKRRGRADAGQWYTTLPAAQLVQLLRQAGYGEPLPLPDLNLDPRPDCGGEFHGADGGPCPACGWDSHPIPPLSAPTPPETAADPLPRDPATPRPQNGPQRPTGRDTYATTGDV